MGARAVDVGERFVVTGGARSLRPAARRAAAVAVGLGVDPRRRADVELAVHEALANALEHGHGGRDTAPVDVEVARCGPQRVVARITDLALAPAATHTRETLPDRGHGRALIRAGTDRLRISTAVGATTVELGWNTGPGDAVRAEQRRRTR